MFAFLVIMHIFVSILLVISILMQSSKGGGLAGTFGGSSSTAFLSGRQAADTMTKATVVLAILFAILSVTLNIRSLRESGTDQGLIEKQLEDQGGAPTLPAEPQQ